MSDSKVELLFVSTAVIIILLAVSVSSAQTLSFNPAVNFSVGSIPIGMVLGDFNADGMQDLAVTNFNDNNISVLLGIGTGSFGAATSFSVGNGARAIAVGDFNGDGKQDLAVANENSNNVSILLGTGTGSFGAAANYAVGVRPRSVSVGDFNGDGKQDLAIANLADNNVSILLGTGTGSFGSATNFAAGTGAIYAAVGDFNGDGKQDLAVANTFSNNLSILLGTGTGTFGSATNYAVGILPRSVAVGDFNGDGKQDLAVVNFTSNDVSILLGTGTGSFGSATNYAVGSGPFALAAADFNADGRPDLAVANGGSNNVSILLGTDIGTFGPATNFAVGTTPRSVVVGDFNGDGKKDLATSNEDSNNVSILLNTTPLTRTVSINNVNVTEGNAGTTNAVFAVTLSAASTQIVTVNFATGNGTATAGTDYVATSGTVTFSPGETTKTIVVAINGDTLNETDETFFVNLSNPVNATIANGQGLGTIINDDMLPSISINNVSVAEGNSGTTNATFTVTLSAASGQVVTVSYSTANGTAIAGSDYIATSGNLTFNPGESANTFTVLINGDTIVEPNVSFFVNLTSATNASIANGQAVGTVIDDDSPPIVSPPPVGPLPDRLANASTRGRVLTGDSVMISGFIIDGSAPKRVLIRSRGPSMAGAPFFVPGTLADPVLKLFSGQTVIAQNDNWQDAPSCPGFICQGPSEVVKTGLDPCTPNPGQTSSPANCGSEAAILIVLPPGAYTAQVTGVGGGTGIGLVEVFEADASTVSELSNISTRAFIQSGDDVMIGGLIIEGSAPATILIRARGPSMSGAPFFVPGTLADPFLQLFSGQSVIAQNNNWQDAPLCSGFVCGNAGQIAATGLDPCRANPGQSTSPPSCAQESAILITLPPGAYTAIVSGVGGGTGVGLMEAFRID
jgi:Calx-beta domain/FG-GAP-like repeat